MSEEQELFEFIRRYGEKRDFSYATFYVRSKLTQENDLFLTTYPQSWRDHYLKENYGTIDYAHQSSNVLWQEAMYDDLSARQKKLFQEAESVGIRSGITRKVSFPEKEIFLTFSSPYRAVSFESVYKPMQEDINRLFNVVHQYLVDPQDEHAKSRLMMSLQHFRT